MTGDHKGPIETDAVIVGAGPVGLFQVFQLGLLEISAHVIDTLPHAGGQCIELYANKPIYDIPGFPVVSGRALIDNLSKQIEPFKPKFHLNQEVSVVEERREGGFLVDTNRGTRFLTKTILIAAGVGAFQPRHLKLDGLGRFDGTQLHYRAPDEPDQGNFANRHLVIVGGEDSALDLALRFAADGPGKASSVTLVHRRDVFQAASETIAKVRTLALQNRIRVEVGQLTGIEEKDGKLTAVKLTDPEGSTHDVPVDHLFVFLGISPKLGPIANWGLDMERKQLIVDTEKFSTSVPGIFAVGDINTYPGKKKLILSGFHECTLAAYAAASICFPDRKIPFQYTTASPRLHKLLGVSDDNPAASE